MIIFGSKNQIKRRGEDSKNLKILIYKPAYQINLGKGVGEKIKEEKKYYKYIKAF